MSNSSCSRPPGEIGPETGITGIVNKLLYFFIAPVHFFSKSVHSAHTGTHVYHLYHGQSESVIEDDQIVH
jgi:hypothetical protein